MTAAKALQARWDEPRWRKLAKRINAVLNARSPNVFEGDLKGLPLSEEVSGWLDLRGAPLTGGAMDQCWAAVDFSFGVTEVWRPIPDGLQQLDGPFTAMACTFEHCRFRRTKLNLSDELQCTDCDFQRANLERCIIKKASFTRCDFRNANLRRAMITDCRFVDCVFTDANFGNAMVIKSEVSGSDFRGMKGNKATGFAALKVSDMTRFDADTLRSIDADEHLRARFESA